jgi:hypothetical protein
MKAFTVLWNPDTDHTAVNFTPEYHDLYNMAKLDLLQDAIFILGQEYEQKLKQKESVKND